MNDLLDEMIKLEKILENKTKQPWEMTQQEFLKSHKSLQNKKPNKLIEVPAGDKTINVFRNPTASNIRELKREFRAEFPTAMVGTQSIRDAEDTDGNIYVWMAGDAWHVEVLKWLRSQGIIADSLMSPEIIHSRYIQYALETGKDVPRRVLKQYPGIINHT